MAAKKIRLTIQLPQQDESKLSAGHINKKLSELSKAVPGILSVETRFRYSKTGETNDKICELYLVISGKNIFTIQKSKSFGDAALKAIDKLQKQLVDNKPEDKEPV